MNIKDLVKLKPCIEGLEQGKILQRVEYSIHHGRDGYIWIDVSDNPSPMHMMAESLIERPEYFRFKP